MSAPAPPSAPTDPATAAKTPRGAYDLSSNDLTSLVSYHHHAAGLSIVSSVSLPAGSLFTKITTSTPAPVKRWSTVQVAADRHIELNSALLYMNHSCAPSLEIHTDSMEVRVARDRALKVGDDLTFFYPSTEWEFDNPFRCLCKSRDCLGDVKGAKYLSKEERERLYLNGHIEVLAQEQDGEQK